MTPSTKGSMGEYKEFTSDVSHGNTRAEVKVKSMKLLNVHNKKLEPFEFRNVMSVQSQTRNYDDVFILSNKEVKLKKLSILKMSQYDSWSVSENGARCGVMTWFLLLYEESLRNFKVLQLQGYMRCLWCLN